MEEASTQRLVTVMFTTAQGLDDIYRGTEDGQIYIRRPINTSACICWYTGYEKSAGRYEKERPIRAATTMRVVDDKGTVLFEETMGKHFLSAPQTGKFSYEEERVIAEEWAAKLNLHTQGAWRAYLLQDWEGQLPNICADAWLYSETKTVGCRILGRMKSLGRSLAVVEELCIHLKSRKAWKIIFLESGGVTLRICGYIWGEEADDAV